MGSIYSADTGVDRCYLISISSYYTMKIYTLSFPTFDLTHSVCDFVVPLNCLDAQRRVVSYPLTWFIHSSNQNHSFSWIPFGCRVRCGGVLMVGSLPSSSIVAPQRPPSGASLKVLSMDVSRCSSDYAWVPSAARLTVYIYTERLKYCMLYYDAVNLVTVTKMNMIRRYALCLCKNHCCENTASSFPQSCTGVSAAFKVSCSTAQQSQLLSKCLADLCRGFKSSKIWLFYKSNLVASWMHLIHCRFFQEHLEILLQSLRVLCLAPGGSGSIWKYLEALVRLHRVSGRIAWGFQAELHCADGASLNSLDLRLTLHLQTCSITPSKVYFQTCLIMASQWISNFTQSRPPDAYPPSLNHGLPLYLSVQSILVSDCISNPTLSLPPSASLSSLNLGLQLHLQPRSITASQSISECT